MKQLHIPKNQLSIFDFINENKPVKKVKHKRIKYSQNSNLAGFYYNCLDCNDVKQDCHDLNHNIMDGGFLWTWQDFLVAKIRRAWRLKNENKRFKKSI